MIWRGTFGNGAKIGMRKENLKRSKGSRVVGKPPLYSAKPLSELQVIQVAKKKMY